MQARDCELLLSPNDVDNFPACQHLTALDLLRARRARPPPYPPARYSNADLRHLVTSPRPEPRPTAIRNHSSSPPPRPPRNDPAPLTARYGQPHHRRRSAPPP